MSGRKNCGLQGCRYIVKIVALMSVVMRNACFRFVVCCLSVCSMYLLSQVVTNAGTQILGMKRV